VIKVIFYVSPLKNHDFTLAELKSEKIPATLCCELTDYMLSFLEMIRGTLVQTCRQVVRIEMEKYYSNKPRTYFKMLSWKDYIALQRKDPTQTDAESLSDSNKEKRVQPKRVRNAESPKKRAKTDDPPRRVRDKSARNGRPPALLLGASQVQERRVSP